MQLILLLVTGWLSLYLPNLWGETGVHSTSQPCPGLTLNPHPKAGGPSHLPSHQRPEINSEL